MTYCCHLFYCRISTVQHRYKGNTLSHFHDSGRFTAQLSQLSQMEEIMKKEVIIFIFDGYADWEPAFLCSELNSMESDYIVKTMSLDKNPKFSMGGFKVVPDYSVQDFPDSFSLLVLTGGTAWIEQKNNSVLPVVEYAVKHQIPVGAICNAVNFMAENGFLDQIPHTGNTLEFMKSQAPHYKGDVYFTERQAVSASGIVTANGSAALEFAKEIFLLIKNKPEDDIEKWYRMHKQGFYPV